MAKRKTQQKNIKQNNNNRKPATRHRGFQYYPFFQKYDAAQTTSENYKHWANADSLSPTAANTAYVREILRKRARYEFANSSYCKGIIETLANDMVGTGPRLLLKGNDSEFNKSLQSLWQKWTWRTNFAQVVYLMKLTKAKDGEAFARFVSDETVNHEVKLRLQLFESDHLNPDEGSDGVEYDGLGNPVAYYIYRQHPGDQNFDRKYERVPAEEIIHWYKSDRPGQQRGVPEITPALPLFALLRRYTLATLSAAETAANFSMLLESTLPPEQAEVEAQDFEQIEIARNMMTTLPTGYKAYQMKAEHPSTMYPDFKSEIIGEIARCLHMPYNIAAANSSGYNYSSGRLDHQHYYRSIDCERAGCELIVLDRVFEKFFQFALLVPGLLPGQPMTDPESHWYWDGMRHVDPQKEALAKEIMISNGLTSLAKIAADDGIDADELLEQIAAEENKRRELGLPSAFASLGASTFVGNSGAADDEDQTGNYME